MKEKKFYIFAIILYFGYNHIALARESSPGRFPLNIYPPLLSASLIEHFVTEEDDLRK
jgi:hypothetical protein